MFTRKPPTKHVRNMYEIHNSHKYVIYYVIRYYDAHDNVNHKIYLKIIKITAVKRPMYLFRIKTFL